jgi:hypothetical protein
MYVNTRLDKIRSEIIRKELEISRIQDVRSKRKQNWVNHLKRMNNIRLHTTKISDSRKTPSTTDLEEEEIVDAPGNDGNASMPEQVKRPKPWRRMMICT